MQFSFIYAQVCTLLPKYSTGFPYWNLFNFLLSWSLPFKRFNHSLLLLHWFRLHASINTLDSNLSWLCDIFTSTSTSLSKLLELLISLYSDPHMIWFLCHLVFSLSCKTLPAYQWVTSVATTIEEIFLSSSLFYFC